MMQQRQSSQSSVTSTPRQSSYRKSYQAQMSMSGSQYTISGEVKVMKEAEREQMKKLNNSLVNYIDKVHDLEQMVKKISC